MNTSDPFANNRALRALIDAAGLTIAEALTRFNGRQARPLALRTLKTYLAHEDAKTRSRCPDNVLERMRTVLSRVDRRG